MENITVYIDWIRHGYSQGNLLSQLNSRTHIKDPMLTKHGINQSLKLSSVYVDRINDCDIVLCSELSRAAETAINMCKKTNIKSIYMIPYVGEIQNIKNEECQPNDPNDIKKKIDNLYPSNQGYPNLNINILKIYRPQYDPNIVVQPNENIFYTTILPTIIKNMKIKKNTYHIAIVSHGLSIGSHFTKWHSISGGVNNTQILTESVKYINKNVVFSLPKNLPNKNICCVQNQIISMITKEELSNYKKTMNIH